MSIPLTSDTKEWWERLYVWVRSRDYPFLVETQRHIVHSVIKNPHERFGRWRRSEVPIQHRTGEHHAIWGFKTEDARNRFMAMYGGRPFILRGVSCS